MSYIVSANYRDRSSPHRWLIREASQHPDEAKPVMRVEATDVAFCGSSDFERGFGCTIVAVCDSVVGFDDAAEVATNGDRLRFSAPHINFDVSEEDERASEEDDGLGFVNTRTNEYVKRVDHLWLNSDGSMYATVSASATTNAQTSEQVAEV